MSQARFEKDRESDQRAEETGESVEDLVWRTTSADARAIVPSRLRW
jgi:hypothetical protein